MPVLPSFYTSPPWLHGGHAQTLYPALFRKKHKLTPLRESFSLGTEGFIETDFMATSAPSPKGLVLLFHGMEGHNRKPYITGMAKLFLQAGWDCLARNCKGCGKKDPEGPKLYTSGQTEDIHALVTHYSTKYQTIIGIGFSMGGNQLLKYLGEYAHSLPTTVKAGIAFSVPCSLEGCVNELGKWQNIIYEQNFLYSLKHKVREMHERYPEYYPVKDLHRIHSFKAFDDRYTAPIHGYTSAHDYWTKASCLHFLPKITIPALMVSAQNDPFLSHECYPYGIASKHPCFYFESPKEGGHVGFVSDPKKDLYWSEQRALAFIHSVVI